MNNGYPPARPDDAYGRLTTAAPPPGERAGSPAVNAATGAPLDAQREDRDEIDLLNYWRVLVKRRRFVIGGLAAGAAAAVVLTLLTTPIYRATATLQIDRDVPEVVKVEGITQVQGGTEPDFYQTQYELLKSRTLAERAAEELNVTDPHVAQQMRAGSLLGRVGGTPRPAAAARVGVSPEQRRQAVDLVQRALEIEPVRNSALIRVNFDSPSPELSARGANAVADGFIASGIERRLGASSYARRYLETQLGIVKARLEASERELVAFAQRENIVNNGEGRSLVSQNLGELTSELATAQSQRVRAQARWLQAQSAHGAELPGDMLKDSIIHTLRERRTQLQADYQDKLQLYKPDYPLMKQLAGELAETDRAISQELANVRASVKAEYDAAAGQERMLSSQLARLRNQTLDVDNRSIQYNILKREVDTNRQLYDGLLQRYKEVGVAGQLARNNISIVDRAEAPRAPYKPSLLKNLAFGALLGLVLGMLVAFLREFIDDTLKSSDDIEQRLRMPVLGIIPQLAPKQTIEQVRDDPRSAFSESYRSVRTALQFSTDHGVPHVLLLTSSGEGEGKSTSALSLARNLAQLGKRVLLIEGDLRNPSLHRTLGMRADVGLSSVLAGVSTAAEAMKPTGDDRLQVILAGPLPPNPAELLAGARLASLLGEASAQFDQVVIDGPPVLGISDAPILANLATGTLLVVRAGRTKVGSAQVATKRLVAARAHMIGALLTMYDARHGGAYGYGYDSYHAYGYGQDSGAPKD